MQSRITLRSTGLDRSRRLRTARVVESRRSVSFRSNGTGIDTSSGRSEPTFLACALTPVKRSSQSGPDSRRLACGHAPASDTREGPRAVESLAKDVHALAPLRQLLDQTQRIERRFHLDVVVEIAVHVAPPADRGERIRDPARVAWLGARAPRGDSFGPPIEHVVAVAAGVDLLVAMKSQVDEVRRHILAIRPSSRGVSHHERDAMTAQERDEGRVEEALVADLDGVANPTVAVDREAWRSFDARIALAG